MARRTGKNLYVEFDGLVIDTAYRNFAVTHEQKYADGTAGADNYDVNVATTKMIGATLELLLDDSASGDAIRNKLKPGATGNLIWGNEGNATGAPKNGFEAAISTANVTTPYNDVISVSVAFVNQGSALLFDETNGDTF